MVFVILIIITFLFYMGLLRLVLKTLRDLVFGSLLFLILVLVFMIWLNTLPLGILKPFELFLPLYLFQDKTIGNTEKLEQIQRDIEGLHISLPSKAELLATDSFSKEFAREAKLFYACFANYSKELTMKLDNLSANSLTQKDIEILSNRLLTSNALETKSLRSLVNSKMDYVSAALELINKKPSNAQEIAQLRSLLNDYFALKEEFMRLKIAYESKKDISLNLEALTDRLRNSEENLKRVNSLLEHNQVEANKALQQANIARAKLDQLESSSNKKEEFTEKDTFSSLYKFLFSKNS